LVQYVLYLGCGKLGAFFPDHIAMDAVKIALVGKVKVAG
jgi:hypothetical protein